MEKLVVCFLNEANIRDNLNKFFRILGKPSSRFGVKSFQAVGFHVPSLLNFQKFEIVGNLLKLIVYKLSNNSQVS